MKFGNLYPGYHAAQRPEAPAIIDGTSGRVLTYSELNDDAWRIAQFYRSLELGSRDSVVLCLENSIEFVEFVWGALYAGLIYTPISTKQTAEEIAYIVQDCGASVLVVSSALSAEIRASLSILLPNVRVVEIEVGAGLPLSVSVRLPEPLPDAVEGMALLYSSGTTGKPKGIKPDPPKNGLGNNPTAMGGLITQLFGFGSSSVYLSPAPLHHAAPLGYVLAVGQIGATAVIMRRFRPEDFLDQIAKYKVTHTQVVPTMFSRLLQLPVELRDRSDLNSLQCVIHAAAPCPPAVKLAMFDWLGPIIHEYYSGSEAVGFAYCSPQDWLSHPGTVGKSLVGAVHILDDDGNEVPVGEEGVIYFENPRRFEYLGDPEKTRRVYSEHGWGTFGDVGRLDDEGFLYLTDRRTDLIITGGVNVYPREVEEMLLLHPAVLDAAVVGLPDEDLGQRVAGVVSLRPGIVEGSDLARDLFDFCRSRLSHVKSPREIQFAPELPRTETGKLLRRVVRDTAKSRPSEFAHPQTQR
ncbi:hypothetical protein A5761_09815 [Mycolicibacterium setense]|uniref:AMP-binding protein n=1 Tax=Mycolicibacterium setense TaxID=431269 RepID=UPI0007EB29A0|nr:AMP-binding protein [Mycolicibacterium setense]OBB17644.1 hypothetical protein A5761_09815 [Mycolicibacterium setense]